MRDRAIALMPGAATGWRGIVVTASSEVGSDGRGASAAPELIDGDIGSANAHPLIEYVRIARLDHWFKNVFMIPGFALAVAVGAEVGWGTLWQVPVGVLAVCLIASANYTINEWLDREFDRFHPIKKHRPSVANKVEGRFVYLQWALLSAAGLGLSALIRPEFLAVNAVLLVMGVLYNVPPIRTKDRVYLDVLSESINNPLRFLLGWFILAPPIVPPSSILVSYWMGGAFLMGIKRYAEYRYINDPERAGLYRKSFQKYTEEKLLISSVLFALISAVAIGVFLIVYRTEFLIVLPFLCVLFAWYLHIGMQSGSVSQTPEKLFRKKKLMLFVALLGLLFVLAFFVDLPWLEGFIGPISTGR
jgi:4-hydroxybenzoate polyprenyltransferase